MIIENLTVTDFRVFEGRQSFDLKPRIIGGKKKPIILFAGLNGAGKTSTLTAIRLALYGRLSLGINTSQKSYEKYLASCIHHGNLTSPNPDSASIELTFTYAHLGEITTYRIQRSWQQNKIRVNEKLSIYENGVELDELNYDQCQAFLNELIPIGVSDLFFFDGEKISELAEDEAGKTLGYSIKKLMGLDLIEVLRSDLLVWLNNQKKQGLSKDNQEQFTKLESQLTENEILASEELSKYELLSASIAEVNQQISRLEADLSSKGGAWAATRENEIRKEEELSAQKRVLEQKLRELISDSYPLSLAHDYVNKVIQDLENEQQVKDSLVLRNTVESKLSNITEVLKLYLDHEKSINVSQKIRNELLKIDSTELRPVENIKHDISRSTYERIKISAKSSLKIKDDIENLNAQIQKITRQLDNAGANIARAPQEGALAEDLNVLNEKQRERAKLISEQKLYSESYKRHLRAALDNARQLDKLDSTIRIERNHERITNVVGTVRELLNEFATEVAKDKVNALEKEFTQSFSKLSRKDDIQIASRIDPRTFTVSLVDQAGNQINKNELSAGEKQVYAISILEALAKTSGRQLPIIVDTPLGRLDSHHRSNIVKNYLPNASHQVVILSTDTEIDEDYYTLINEHVSHAYRLEYSSETMSTNKQEGYFWKRPLESLA